MATRGRSTTTLARVRYRDLNARQKENFNFQKVSAVLADYGFATIRLSDDWQGADFIAQHVSGDVLRVQLKGRLAFSQKYRGKGLFVAFADGDAWYLYPHDEVLSKVLARTKVGATPVLARAGRLHVSGDPAAAAQTLGAVSHQRQPAADSGVGFRLGRDGHGRLKIRHERFPSVRLQPLGHLSV